MNTTEAIQLLRQKMNEHGLDRWGTRWLRQGTYRCYGLCNYRRKDISLNREFCAKAPYEEVLDVVLHEIAHALAFIRHGQSCKHDYRWKRVCVEIGADPSRLYTGEVRVEGNRAKKEVKFILRHCETGKVYKKYYCKPKWGIGRLPRLCLQSDRQGTLGKLEIVPFEA